MAIIEVDHVTKEFRLGQLTSLGQSLRNGANRLLGRAVDERAPFKALDDVSFSVEQGEVLGIIGHNGAGKSTMLKLLARIAQPTRGRIAVHGRVAPLIEVGAGLVGEMTGRENIFLNASILGMKRAAIKRKFDEIVAFAELEEFIDTPIKRYSSGMQVRLGFAIATSVDAEILIVDEVLAVGDLAFQRKCFDRMEDLIRRRGNTVLLVSHNLRQVERLCSRVLMLDHGRLVMDGKPTAVCNEFYQRADQKIAENAAAKVAHHGRYQSSDDIDLLLCELLDESGRATTSIQYGTDLTVALKIAVRRHLKDPVFGVGVHTTDFVYITTSQSLGHVSLPSVSPGEYRILCRFPKLPLLPGVYSIRLGIALGASVSPIFYGENLQHFQVTASGLNRAWVSESNEGFFALETQWEIESGLSQPKLSVTESA